MGVKLVVEVLDYSPEDLNTADRLVLVALAEKAHDGSRRVLWPSGEDPRAVLRRRSGLTESGLKKTFARLASRGLDPRVPVSTDKVGRPVFAFEGRRAEYVIPVLRGDLLGNPLEEESRPPEEPSDTQEGPLQGPSGDPTGNPVEPERVPSGDPLVPLSLDSLDASARDAARAAVEALVRRLDGLDAETAARAVVSIIERKSPDHPERYVRGFSLEDVKRWAGEPRGHAGPAPGRCPHGINGGLRIIGRGDQASRVCWQCDQDAPATKEAEVLAS